MAILGLSHSARVPLTAATAAERPETPAKNETVVKLYLFIGSKRRVLPPSTNWCWEHNTSQIQILAPF